MARRIRPISHEDRLSIVEHLDELRTRLIICALAFGVAWGITAWQNDLVLRIVNHPLPRGIEPITLGPAEAFYTTLTNSAYAALIIALPVILYQLYAFLLPAFSPTERRVALPLLLLVPVLFIAGVVFCYFVVLAPALDVPPQLQRGRVQHPGAGARLLLVHHDADARDGARLPDTRGHAGRLQARGHDAREAAQEPPLRDRGRSRSWPRSCPRSTRSR